MAPCTYLGFVVVGGHRCPEDCKVEVIRSFPQPTTKSHIRSFLGLTGYYRDFVPDSASHSFHLTKAMKTSAPDRVNWTDDMNIEYCYLHECLCSSPCLCFPLTSDLFCLQSSVGIGAVLSVVCGKVESSRCILWSQTFSC